MTGDANAYRFIFIDLKFCPELFNIPDTSIKTSALLFIVLIHLLKQQVIHFETCWCFVQVPYLVV